MPAEWVLDASLVAAVLFDEERSPAARRFLAAAVEADAVLSAPDLMALEIASIAAKKVWRGETSETDGSAAIEIAFRLLGPMIPMTGLAQRAYALAARHRFSAYDAAYLALAENRNGRVATLDARLANRADQEGFGHLTHAIT